MRVFFVMWPKHKHWPWTLRIRPWVLRTALRVGSRLRANTTWHWSLRNARTFRGKRVGGLKIPKTLNNLAHWFSISARRISIPSLTISVPPSHSYCSCKKNNDSNCWSSVRISIDSTFFPSVSCHHYISSSEPIKADIADEMEKVITTALNFDNLISGFSNAVNSWS